MKWPRYRDQGDVATSLGVPGATRSWKTQEGPSLRASGAGTALSDFRFLASRLREKRFLLF